jgi:lipopolysaccharide/colanic/teichoic acid biosynthesis glycosyltransferase
MFDDTNSKVGVISSKVAITQKQSLYFLTKRAFDFLFAIIALINLSPVFLIICILIKAESRGPAIFKQKRVGKDGKIFTFYKFRSMYTDCDQGIHQRHVEKVISGQTCMSKVKDDPRITKIGHFLRATIMDELPQLFNVIKGEMSMIGPRPHPCYEVENYKDWHRERLEILPGITGLWQINKWSYETYDEAIQIDINYVRNVSFTLDFKIFFKTVLLFITPRVKI